MKKCKATVFGHFGYGLNLVNGQTVKARIITEELTRRYGASEIQTVDTHGRVNSILRAPEQVVEAIRRSNNVIILPAHNGLRVYATLLDLLRGLNKSIGLHYVVIGGWLPEFLSRRSGLLRHLKSFDGIYVETNTMKNAMEQLGFRNIYVMQNCKRLNILTASELVYSKSEPLKLCTFSRVMKEKGIEDAVEAVKAVNEQMHRIVYTLDIYGQVDTKQTGWFENLENGFPEYIRYGGIIPFDKSVEVLKNYFALLFPTRFYTEGIPGTIIDAYTAGIPVISARWESFGDVIKEDVVGKGYEFGNYSELVKNLKRIANEPAKWNRMKTCCIREAEQFQPQQAMEVLVAHLT